MTDYPTRAEIQTTRKTLLYLHSQVDTSTVLALIAREVLWDATRILDALDDVPGLHYPSPEPEPEPEPKPTAAELLKFAYACTGSGTPEQGIMYAAKRYAEEHPDWFADWHEHDSPQSALLRAARRAYGDGNRIADSALVAASKVALEHPELFGGAS